MKLTYEQIQRIAQGAVRIEQANDRITLSRLTAEQETLLAQRDEFFHVRARASAGIRFEFRTDSRTLSLSVQTSVGSAIRTFAFDIFVNGHLVSVLEGEQTDSGLFDGECQLGEGVKDVRVYFPWSARAELISFELDDGSTADPLPKSKKMLMFGDSITQGAIAQHPSRTYASQLADALDAEAFNKAIAGDVFHAPYAKLAENGSFDYITIAYGSNDWKKTTRESFVQNCTEFYRTISQKYPTAKIFAITPIWRADPDRITEVGSFSFVKETITRLASELSNVAPIDAFDFVPKDPAYFADLRLHPNDEGFDYYAKALIKEIQKHL